MADYANRMVALARLRKLARRVEARMRISAALDALVSLVGLGLIVTVAALALVKIVPGFPARLARDIVAGATLSAVAGTACAASRRLPKLTGAMALDAHYGLFD